MNLVQSFLTKNPCYTSGRKITVKGLMLHSVGCPQPSAQVFIKTGTAHLLSRRVFTDLLMRMTELFIKPCLGITEAGTVVVLLITHI